MVCEIFQNINIASHLPTPHSVLPRSAPVGGSLVDIAQYEEVCEGQCVVILVI